MRKSCYLVFVILVLIVCPLKCQAESLLASEMGLKKYDDKIIGEFITSGYTENSVYYEAFGEKVETRAAESIYVTRTIVYEGILRPDNNIDWKEYINGVAYAGTLSLIEFDFDAGTTTALYEGTLYKVE